MNPPEQTPRVSSKVVNNSAGKKPYLKPEVRHERVFETMALSCGKVQGTQSNCRSNRKVS